MDKDLKEKLRQQGRIIALFESAYKDGIRKIGKVCYEILDNLREAEIEINKGYLEKKIRR